jgi:hypothetical protein
MTVQFTLTLFDASLVLQNFDKWITSSICQHLYADLEDDRRLGVKETVLTGPRW